MEETELIEGEVVEIKVCFERTQTFHRHSHADLDTNSFTHPLTYMVTRHRHSFYGDVVTVSPVCIHSFSCQFTGTDPCHEHSLTPVIITNTSLITQLHLNTHPKLYSCYWQIERPADGSAASTGTLCLKTTDMETVYDLGQKVW